MAARWPALIAMVGLVSLVSRLSYSYVVRDEPDVRVRAVLRRVTCVLESSGPDTAAGPGGAEALPPVWFERGVVTAVLGAARLWLHAFPAEPAVVTVRALFGDVTIGVPDDGRRWNVRFEPRVLAGQVRDDRPGDGPTDDSIEHLVVTGFVAFGRVRFVRRTGEDR